MEKNYRSRARRKIALALSLMASSVVAVAATSASEVSVASAAGPITVTAPKTVKQYTTNRSEWLPGFTVKNNTPFNLIVTVGFAEAPKGTQFSIGRTKNLTLGYGVSGWTNRTSISFSGKAVDINEALYSMKLHTTSKGKVTVRVTATADDTKFVYEPTSSHYYGFVEAKNIKWTDALTQAAALSFRDTPAYLAAITSEEENDFISYNIENAANAWIGATDKDKEGEFKWVTGESAGTTFWKAKCSDATGADACTGANNVDSNGTYKTTAIDNPLVNTYASWDRGVGKWGQAYEPNNYFGDEDYVATNWLGTSGRWNDLPETDTRDITGYIVEFANQPGKPFNGVVEAMASYNVVPTPSIYAPSAVTVSKGQLGQVLISWKEPKVVKKPTLLMKVTKNKLKGYVVTAASRNGEEFCTDSKSQTQKYCVLDGFLPGEELRFTVQARYAKPPLGLGRLGRGQKVFGTSGVTNPADYVLPARLDLPNFRPVRDGTRVVVAGNGLKPGSSYTVKANGVLVASGTVGSDGLIPAGKSFVFPYNSLPSGPLERSKVEYAMRATPVDGAETDYYISYFFSGRYVWGAVYGVSAASDYFVKSPGVLVVHTPIAN